MTVLLLVLCFGAFANAAFMVAPVVHWVDALLARSPALTEPLVLAVFFSLSTLLLPVGLAGAAALWSGWVSQRSWTSLFNRFALTFLPLGFSMWLAHFSFHLFTAFDSVFPASARALNDLGLARLGVQPAGMAMGPDIAWVESLEILLLDVGLLGSLYLAWRTSRDLSSAPARMAWPWAVIITALYASGVWLLTEPMEMRGMAM